MCHSQCKRVLHGSPEFCGLEPLIPSWESNSWQVLSRGVHRSSCLPVAWGSHGWGPTPSCTFRWRATPCRAKAGRAHSIQPELEIWRSPGKKSRKHLAAETNWPAKPLRIPCSTQAGLTVPSQGTKRKKLVPFCTGTRALGMQHKTLEQRARDRAHGAGVAGILNHTVTVV